jgi:hypothetical protein
VPARRQPVSFDTHFRECLRAANRTDLWAAVTLLDGFWVSTDAFQDFRSWLVSRGRAVFERVLRDPDSLAGAVEPEDDFEFEGFCYIAGRVWEEKSGRNRQEMYGKAGPPGQATGPEGEQLDEAELERRFPKLWARSREDD